MQILVCARYGHFADDVAARCAMCDTAIVRRPHADPALVKMCIACAGKTVLASPWPLPPDVRISEETRRELALWDAKTKSVQ